MFFFEAMARKQFEPPHVGCYQVRTLARLHRIPGVIEP